MKNLNFKRILAILPSLCLTFSLMPVGAFAAEVDGGAVCAHTHDENCG